MSNDEVEPDTQILEEKSITEDAISKPLNDSIVTVGDSELVEINDVRTNAIVFE